MNTDLILSNLSKHITLSAQEKDYFTGLLEEKKVNRNEFILRNGDPCEYIYFLNSGTLRAYFVNPKGKDSTIMFAVKDWWITDMYCFLNGLNAMVNIQGVEQCDTLRLSKQKLELLYHHIPAFNKFFRILMQNAYCREQLRMIQNLSLPASVRYKNFQKKYPHIARKISLKHTASYLGVTPEFLSTIRANKN